MGNANQGKLGEAFNRFGMVVNSLVARSSLASFLGKSFGGKRDLYATCGYPNTLTYNDFYGKYTRLAIASAVVNAYPDRCWRQSPLIYESEDENETPFETSWNAFVKNYDFSYMKEGKSIASNMLWHYLHRIDRMAGIGQYGVLLLGFDDGQTMDKEVTKATKLLYFKPLTEDKAQIQTYESNIQSPRYGLPLYYNLQITTGDYKSETRSVHWSRVIHVAEDCLNDDVFGTPRLMNVYNNLQNIELIDAGATEMFWRGGFPGISFEMDADVDPKSIDVDVMQKDIEKYVHGLTRYLKLQGVTAKPLSPTVADPTPHFDMQVTQIAMAKKIPKRILTGTEEAKLASSQDKDNWLDNVEDRRIHFCEPNILRPFIDRLVAVGIIEPPAEEGGYIVEWPPLAGMSKQEEANVAKTKTEAMSSYVSGSVNSLIPPYQFLTEILKLPDEFVKKSQEEVEVQFQEEEQARLDEMQQQMDAQKNNPAVTNPESQTNPQEGNVQ